MRIFFTGGTGYIGLALARRLTAAGHELRCLVRPGSDGARLASLGAACFPGDVTDRYSMRPGMSGAEWVIHAAAVVGEEQPAGELTRVNVAGSENVASLAYKLGVGRLLHVSSVAAFGGSPADGSAAAEEAAVQRPLPTLYSRSKHDAECAVREWAARGLRLNTVYPSLVYGPPGKATGANAILAAIARGRQPAIVAADRIVCWVHIEDVVDGIVRVIERAPPGPSYLLTGEAVTIARLVELAAAAAGVAPPRLRLPLQLAAALAALAAPVWLVAGRRPRLGREQVRSLRRHWHFDDSRARRELDWRPRGLREGLADCGWL